MRYTAYITEYGNDGEAEDSFKEWFDWDDENQKPPTRAEAADILNYPEGDIEMIIKQK